MRQIRTAQTIQSLHVIGMNFPCLGGCKDSEIRGAEVGRESVQAFARALVGSLAELKPD